VILDDDAFESEVRVFDAQIVKTLGEDVFAKGYGDIRLVKYGRR